MLDNAIRNQSNHTPGLGLLIAVVALAPTATTATLAQMPASAKTAPSAKAAKPAPLDQQRIPLVAVVVDVEGTVESAAAGVSPIENLGWKPVKVKDRLSVGMQIRTGLRSSANLKFGETTFVAIRSASYAGLDQLYRSATTEHIKIGLGYGAVRGGSIEGPMRSNVVIDSTVATLAKRGTEGWQMDVEPATGRFTISLAEHGLVDAIQKLRTTGRSSRSVRPGEYATDANIANLWIKQDIFDRNVQFYQADAVTVADSEFSSENTRGYGVVSAGGGSTLTDTAGRTASDFALEQIERNFAGGTLPQTTVVVPKPIARPEGNFGTGRTFQVLLPEALKRTTHPPAGAIRGLGR